MTRTIADIKKIITDAILQNSIFQALGFDPAQTWDSQVSKTNVFDVLAYIVAFAIWSLESLFTLHKNEVNEIIAQQKSHSRNWSINKALAFQYGRDLEFESDYYDNSALTDEEIEAEQIVKQCAVDETDGGKLYIKIACEVDGELERLSEVDPDQLTPFKQYLSEIKDAGVPIVFINHVADYLKLAMVIYYNPLVLDENGARLDGADNSPVDNAIKTYIKNLKFNGEYSNLALIDALQNVEGVEIPELKNAQAKYGENDWVIIDAKYIPDAGYLKIYDPADLTLTYKAYV
jgi:hypothetical protein